MPISGLENLTKNKVYNIEIYSFSKGPYSAEQSTVKFPAFLTDFTDSFKSDWQSQTVYGKMDPIATFKNTTRSIALAFDVPNESPEVAEKNLRQIDYLIKGMYPIYSSGQLGTRIISSPPMFRVKFANFVSKTLMFQDSTTLRNGLLCYMPSFDFKPKTDSGFFVVNGDTLLPKLITVNLSLNIIHEEPLGSENVNGKIQNRITFGSFPHFPFQAPTADIDNESSIDETSSTAQAETEKQNSEKQSTETKILQGQQK